MEFDKTKKDLAQINLAAREVMKKRMDKSEKMLGMLRSGVSDMTPFVDIFINGKKPEDDDSDA